jgi:hypothetical protein
MRDKGGMHMELLSILSQLIIAVSIIIVWVFRFDNIVKEFKQYGLSDLTRNSVGAVKIALSTLLVTAIWYPSPVVIPALFMAFLMVCAQAAHFKVKNPWSKHAPSLILLILSLFVAAYHSGIFG